MRTPLPEIAVAELRQYKERMQALEAESMAYLRGLVVGQGLDPDTVSGVDLGEDPALVLREISEPSSDLDPLPDLDQE